MMFRLTNNLNSPIETKKSDIIKIAYKRIYYYKMTPPRKILSQYLEKNYGQDLKTCCKKLIINKLQIKDGAEDNTIIVTFIDNQSDNLAALITYGNSEVQGCNILRFAFDQRY